MLAAEDDNEPFIPADEIDEEDIVERIFEAVIEQRLPAGTKLSESGLCEAFGVGRMRIRRSLLLLASREVVELHPNRGAFVASPTVVQAREVFEARCAIEPNVARLAVERATPADILALEQHLKQEEVAHETGNRRDAIRLSGQFHIMLAQIAANGVMLRMIKELITRTSLIIGIFGAPGMANCRDEDHGLILEAFKSGDKDVAARLMRAHLEHIQDHIDLGVPRGNPVDLVTLFAR
ncbi:MAG: GntR family transcriptional regulator [Paracoccaceae bacterium]